MKHLTQQPANVMHICHIKEKNIVTVGDVYFHVHDYYKLIFLSICVIAQNIHRISKVNPLFISNVFAFIRPQS